MALDRLRVGFSAFFFSKTFFSVHFYDNRVYASIGCRYLKGFSLLWMLRTCRCRLDEIEKDRSQYLHLYGCSPAPAPHAPQTNNQQPKTTESDTTKRVPRPPLPVPAPNRPPLHSQPRPT